MFKSRINQDEFDLNNKKIKDVKFGKVKTLAKGSVKKLIASPEEQTTFHLVLDYFKNKAGKSLGPFLCFGINKKMDKHFQQVEMKSGKMDQSMSSSPKQASMGMAYGKEQDGKVVLCLEPDAKSKIPKGQWPKIIKALKPFLAGNKAVVVFEGQMIGEEYVEPETSEETTDQSTDQTAPEDTDTPTEETSTEETTSTSSTDETVDPSGRAKREKTLNTLNNGITKMDGAVGRVDKVKLQANIEKYEAALVKLIEEANADGVVDDQEKTAIAEAEEKLAALKQNVEENGGKLTPERLEKVKENIGQIEARLERLFAGLGV